MFRGYGLALVVVALALVTVLVALPDEAGAQSGYCPESGIVPDSAFVVSSTNQAGAVAGHKIWFQLCQPLGVESGADGDAPRLSRIALIWQDAGYYPGQGFFLNNREAAGITLRELGGDRSWNATTEPYGGNCCVGTNNRSVAVDFNQDIFSTDTPTGKASPLTLQFEIPVAAGMINPLKQGKYRWEIVTIYDHGRYCSTHAEEFSSIMLEVAPGDIELWPGSGAPGSVTELTGEIHLSESSGGPGSVIELRGTGFKPLSLVQSVKVGGIDVKPRHKVSTDDEGSFRLEIIIPGVDVGNQQVLVQVGEMTAVTMVTVVYYSPSFDIFSVKYELEPLGDNFVVIFHFNPDTCQWSFYDPDIPESDLAYLITGETYWLLVKEPQEVILGGKYRNLTCTPDGNCWNRIVW